MVSPTPAPEVAALFASEGVSVFRSELSETYIAAMHPVEADATGRMAPRRRLEFATGRACAREALRDRKLAADAVARGAAGEPVWPDGATGSISHTAGICIAVAGLAHQGVVGIDVEQVARVAESVQRRILTETERQAIERLPPLERQRLAAKTWALKEAFYKAHFQVDARYLGFGAVSLNFGTDGTVVFVSADGSVAESVLSRVVGRCAVVDQLVIAAVTIL